MFSPTTFLPMRLLKQERWSATDVRARSEGSMRLRSGELALAQPEESDSRIVMENSARVWRCDANRPFVLTMADCVTPVVKMPAAVCLFFSAMSAIRATARARSAGGAGGRVLTRVRGFV